MSDKISIQHFEIFCRKMRWNASGKLTHHIYSTCIIKERHKQSLSTLGSNPPPSPNSLQTTMLQFHNQRRVQKGSIFLRLQMINTFWISLHDNCVCEVCVWGGLGEFMWADTWVEPAEGQIFQLDPVLSHFRLRVCRAESTGGPSSLWLSLSSHPNP